MDQLPNGSEVSHDWRYEDFASWDEKRSTVFFTWLKSLFCAAVELRGISSRGKLSEKKKKKGILAGMLPYHSD